MPAMLVLYLGSLVLSTYVGSYELYSISAAGCSTVGLANPVYGQYIVDVISTFTTVKVQLYMGSY